jgi:hypothetical protein
MAEMTVPLVSRGNGRWGSPSPAWNHLIDRESSGIPDIIQQIHDVNSGGNEAEGLFQITPATWRANGGTDFADSARHATPQQQAIVAARIFTRNPTGSDWGAGRSGRESASDLAAGLVSLDPNQSAQEPAVPDNPNRPAYNAFSNWTKNQSTRGGTAIDCVFIHTNEPANTPSMNYVNDGALNLSNFIRSTEGGANPVSYHTVASQNLNDKGVTVVYCADTANKSWSVGNSNPRSLNYCFGGSFSGWTTEQWMQQSGAIDAIAWEIVTDCIKYGLTTKDKRPPVDWSTNYAHNPPVISDHRYCSVKLRDGNNHTDVDNGRGTFPWQYLEDRINEYTDIQLGIANEPTTTPEVPPVTAPKPVGPADDQVSLRWNCLGGQTLVEAVAEIRDKVCGHEDRDKTGAV